MVSVSNGLHPHRKYTKKEILRNRAIVLGIASTLIITPLVANVINKTQASFDNIMSNSIMQDSFKPKQLIECKESIEYYVQPGDTFFHIVNNYMKDNGLNEDRREIAFYIEKYNGVSSYGNLQIGETIKLPIIKK